MGAARWPQRALTWRDRLSLRAKFSLLLGLVAAAPLLLVGPVLVRDSRDALRADARAQATATAQLGAGLARRYLVDARNVLEELAGRPLIVAAVAAGDADFVQAALERHLRQYDEQFANFNWLDTDAVLRASAEPSAALGSRLGGTSFDESLKRLDTYVGRPAPSRVTGEPIVPMAIAIRQGGQPVGVLLGTVDLSALSAALVSDRPGDRWRVSVVDLVSGDVVAATDSARLLKPATSVDEALARMRAGESGALEITPTSETATLVGYAAVPDLQWGVLVEQPLEQALLMATVLQWRGALLVLCAVVAAMALGWLLGRWLSRPLRELQVATTRVAAGDLGYSVPVRGQDELGQVAASFNAMSADLAEAIATEARLRHAAEALAARETLLNLINARIRASLDTETVLRATLEELGTALHAARAFLHIEGAGRTLSYAYEWTRPGVVPTSVYRPRRMVVADLAVRERRAVAVTDVDTDPRFLDPALPPRTRAPGTGTRAILTAPLFLGDTLLGVLGIHDLAARVWTPDEIALVEGVAGEAAVAVANARLYEEAQTRAQRLAAVARINRAISARLDLATVVEVVGQALGQLVPFDRISLLGIDAEGRTYRVLGYTLPLLVAPNAPEHLPVAGTRLEQMQRERQAVAEADLAASTEPLTAQEERLREAGFRSRVLVPVLAEPDAPGAVGRVLGALSLASRESHRYGPGELEILEPVCGQLAVALRNAELYAEVTAGQQRLAAILAGIAEGVYVTDRTGCIVLWNAAAERILGFRAADVVGRPWHTVLRGHDPDGRPFGDPQGPIAGAVQRGAMGNSELRMTTLQGEELWVSLSTSTVEVGEQRHRIFVFRDISAYKEVERLKSDFVSTVSHELRTPLASIKGYAATLLQRGARLPNNVRDEYLAIINHEADRLNGLVSDLLDVARLEQRQVRVEQRPTPLAPIARRVVDLARARTDRHRLELAVPPDLVAQAAPDRLEQVLTNLVENALKYSPRGGTVRVEGRRVDGHVALAVVDEGIGIAPERQGELFRPFARLESTLTRETEGAGLGLYICKQLVERMGGTIALASAPGRGTTVTVILAAAEPVLSAE